MTPGIQEIIPLALQKNVFIRIKLYGLETTSYEMSWNNQKECSNSVSLSASWFYLKTNFKTVNSLIQFSCEVAKSLQKH